MNENRTDRKIDITGLVCPYTFVKAKLAIEAMDVGQVLEILLDFEEASRSIPTSMKDHGHTVLDVAGPEGGRWTLRIRKEKD